jgi:hypothetical protein
MAVAQHELAAREQRMAPKAHDEGKHEQRPSSVGSLPGHPRGTLV